MLLTGSAANPVSDRVPRKYQATAIGDLDSDTRLQIAAAFGAGRGIVFEGPVGRGKTHAMAATATELGGHGFISWTEFLETIRAWWNIKGDDRYKFDPTRWAGRVHELFIDDVGTESSRTSLELGADSFPQIVNARYNAGLRTFLTTNLTVEELTARYGPRTVSRLAETCDWVVMNGNDRRLSPLSGGHDLPAGAGG